MSMEEGVSESNLEFGGVSTTTGQFALYSSEQGLKHVYLVNLYYKIT